MEKHMNTCSYIMQKYVLLCGSKKSQHINEWEVLSIGNPWQVGLKNVFIIHAGIYGGVVFERPFYSSFVISFINFTYKAKNWN